MDSLWFITWHFYFIFSKNFQRIEGFLAVLNVTGGNFSPKSQKLPFAVTSVDGDNYLLYYSTIDLPANVAASKCRKESHAYTYERTHTTSKWLFLEICGFSSNTY
jgi:hypothetical protein